MDIFRVFTDAFVGMLRPRHGTSFMAGTGLLLLSIISYSAGMCCNVVLEHLSHADTIAAVYAFYLGAYPAVVAIKYAFYWAAIVCFAKSLIHFGVSTVKPFMSVIYYFGASTVIEHIAPTIVATAVDVCQPVVATSLALWNNGYSRRMRAMFNAFMEAYHGTPLQRFMRLIQRLKILTHVVLIRAWLSSRLSTTEFLVALGDLNGAFFCRPTGPAKVLRDLLYLLAPILVAPEDQLPPEPVDDPAPAPVAAPVQQPQQERPQECQQQPQRRRQRTVPIDIAEYEDLLARRRAQSPPQQPPRQREQPEQQTQQQLQNQPHQTLYLAPEPEPVLQASVPGKIPKPMKSKRQIRNEMRSEKFKRDTPVLHGPDYEIVPDAESPVLRRISAFLSERFGIELYLERYSRQTAIVLTILAGLFGVFFSDLSPNAFVSWVNRNAAFWKNFSVVRTTVGDFAQQAIGGVCSLLQMGEPLPSDHRQLRAYQQLREQVKMVQQLETLLKHDAPGTIAQAGGYDAIMAKISSIEAIVNKCAEAKIFASPLFNEFQATTMRCVNIMTQYRATSAAVVEPVVIWLYGDPGVGKSVVMSQIVKTLSHLHGRDLSVWSGTSNIKHFDGYAQQDIVFLDDYLAVTEGADMFLHLVTPVAYRLPMADLPDKGMIFNSKYIIVSSNKAGMEEQGARLVVNPQAFNRRRHFWIHVTRRQFAGLNDNRMMDMFETAINDGNHTAVEYLPRTHQQRLLLTVQSAYERHQQHVRRLTAQITAQDEQQVPVEDNIQEFHPPAERARLVGVRPAFPHVPVQQGPQPEEPAQTPNWTDEQLAEMGNDMTGEQILDYYRGGYLTQEEFRKIMSAPFTSESMDVKEKSQSNPVSNEQIPSSLKEFLAEAFVRDREAGRLVSGRRRAARPREFTPNPPKYVSAPYELCKENLTPMSLEAVAPQLEKRFGKKWTRTTITLISLAVLLFGSITLYRFWKLLKTQAQIDDAQEEALKIPRPSTEFVKTKETYGTVTRPTTIVNELKLPRVITERVKRRGPIPIAVKKSIPKSDGGNDYSNQNFISQESYQDYIESGDPVWHMPPDAFELATTKFRSWFAPTKEAQIAAQKERREYKLVSERKRRLQKIKAVQKKDDHPVSGDDTHVVRDTIPQEQACADTQCLSVADSVVARNTVFFHAYDDEGKAIDVSALMIKGHIGVTVKHAVTGFTSFFVSNGGSAYEATPIVSMPNRDVAFFRLDRTAPQFPDITRHLRSQKAPALQQLVLGMLAIKRKMHTIYTVGCFDLMTKIKPRDAETVDSIPFKIRTNVAYALDVAVTTYGDCGSVYFVMNTNYHEKIVGLHFAGTVETSFCAPLYREDLEKVMPLVADSSEPIEQGLSGDYKWEVAEDEDARAEAEELFPGAEYVGTPCSTSGDPRPIVQPVETRLHPSPFAHENFPNLHEPAILDNKDKRLEEKKDVLIAGIQKWVAPRACEIDQDMFEEAKNEVAAELIAATRGQVFRVLSSREALTGTTDIPVSSGIDLTTSGGFRFLSTGGGKHAYITRAGNDQAMDFVGGPNGERLKNAMHDLTTAFANEQEVPIVFKASAKDEALKLEKVKTGATRIFAASPLDLLLVQRRFIGAALWACVATRRKTPIKVGINVESIEFKELYHYMHEVSDEGFCADYKNFDGSIPREFMLAVAEIYNKMYQAHDPDWKPEHDRIRRGMYLNISGPNLGFRKFVIKAPRGNPSGQVGTTIDNCIVNMLVYRYCYKMATKGHPELNKMNAHVRLAVYGDDNIVTVSEAARPYFSFDQMKAEVAKLGMELTPAEKGAITCPFVSVEKMTFLKRQFIVEGELVYGRLERASVSKMLNWTRAGRHKYERGKTDRAYNLETLRAAADSIARTMALYPEHEYNTIMNHVAGVLANAGHSFVVEPWKSVRHTVLYENSV